MAQLFGRAAILWTEALGERTYLLRVPLQKVQHGFRQRVYAADSLDYSSREVISVGAGVYELVGRIRYDEDPQTLLDLLKAGGQGLALTYVPDTGEEEEYVCDLIEPMPDPAALLELGADFVATLEEEVTIRLRRTGGGVFL